MYNTVSTNSARRLVRDSMLPASHADSKYLCLLSPFDLSTLVCRVTLSTSKRSEK